MTENQFKSGFISIAGAPNAGKSTLLNKMLGQKISITSRKPQTTRNRILGVVHKETSQQVFIDTPGVHRASSPLNVMMVDAAISSFGDVDVILLLIDVSTPDPDSEKIIINKLKKQKKPVVLALNKIDLIKKHELLEMIERWSSAYEFKSVIPVSAKHGTQVDQLLNILENLLPEGPPLFPEDTLTDLPTKFIVAELIREKVFRQTGQEIPYSIAVTIDSFEKKKKLVTIHASIHVERDSQKGIVIGKGGEKLKRIGTDARHEIEELVQSKVLLKLFVRVQKNWSNDTRALRNFGY